MYGISRMSLLPPEQFPGRLGHVPGGQPVFLQESVVRARLAVGILPADALVAHFDRKSGPAKVAVWEHNSHLGDARATDMGRRGELNVGQLTRCALQVNARRALRPATWGLPR